MTHLRHDKSIRFLVPILLSTLFISAVPIRFEPTDKCLLVKVGTPSGTITIGGLKCVKGDKFNADQRISLAHDEFIKGRNLRTGDKFKICGADLKNTGVSSINAFIRVRTTSDKGTSDLETYLIRFPWCMIEDTVSIPIHHRTMNRSCGFVFKSIPGNIELGPAVPFDPETNELVITKESLIDNGIFKPGQSLYRFHVEYFNDNSIFPITNNLIIQYIPSLSNQ